MRVARTLAGIALSAAAATLSLAQGPRMTAALPGIDLSGLNAVERSIAYQLLTGKACSCGCGMTIAECRAKDPTCYYSRGLTNTIVDSLKSGKSGDDAWKDASNSRYAHVDGDDGKVLSDAVPINTAGSPRLGPANAKIRLIEFSDFQCPYCILAVGEIKNLMKAYPNEVSLTFKQFPLDTHSAAAIAAAAAVAAQKQGKFWELHDAMFSQRGRLSRVIILSLAEQVGLDKAKFLADLDASATQKIVEKDVDDGFRAGVMGTPSLFVNGQRYNRALRTDLLKIIVDAELKSPHADAVQASARKP